MQCCIYMLHIYLPHTQVVKQQYRDSEKEWKYNYSFSFIFGEEQQLYIPDNAFLEIKDWTVRKAGTHKVCTTS